MQIEEIIDPELTNAWSCINTRQYNNLKVLKKENLRDNMSTLEMALNGILILYKEAERISNLPSLDQMLRTVENGKM